MKKNCKSNRLNCKGGVCIFEKNLREVSASFNRVQVGWV